MRRKNSEQARARLAHRRSCRPAQLGYACLLALPVLPQQSTQTQLPMQSQVSTQSQYSMQSQAPPSTVATLTPFAEETFTTDDNVFRITNQVPPETLIGFPARGDTYRTTS